MKKITHLILGQIGFVFVTLVLLASFQNAQAADRYWSSTTSGAQTDGGGTWEATDQWVTTQGGSTHDTWNSSTPDVAFIGNGGIPGTITLSAVTVGSNGITFNSVASGHYVVSGGTITLAEGSTTVSCDSGVTGEISSTIAGIANELVKQGGGVLLLTGDNSYDHGTVLNEGTLGVDNNNCFGTGGLTINGGKLATTQTGGGATLFTEPLIINADFTVDDSILTNQLNKNIRFSGGVILRNGDRTINVDNPHGQQVNLVLGGGGNGIDDEGNGYGIIKNGGGWLALTEWEGKNTYGGDTTINAGQLRLTTQIAVLGNGAGKLRLSGGTLCTTRTRTVDIINPFELTADSMITSESTSDSTVYCVFSTGDFTFSGGTLGFRNNGGSGTVFLPAFSGNGFDFSRPIGITNGNGTTVLLSWNLSGDQTFSGAISGDGSFTRMSGGRTILTGANTYTGDTTVSAGTLLVNSPGSLAPESAVSVAIDATLGGDGTINGPVTIDYFGILSPGASVGTLTINSNLILGGDLIVELDKSLSPSNDFVNVSGVLTNAGIWNSLTLTNVGPALADGDRFQLFNKPLLNGEALTIVSPGGDVWTNKLWLDGSVEVLSAAAPPALPATDLTIQAAGANSYALGGKGAPNTAYDVYAATNVTTPMSNWWLLGTTNSDGSGGIQFLDSQATNAQRFYRFGQTVIP